MYDKLEIEFHNEDEAKHILELVRYANVLNQKPLVADELRFIARYPEVTRKLLMIAP